MKIINIGLYLIGLISGYYLYLKYQQNKVNIEIADDNRKEMFELARQCSERYKHI